MLSIGVSPRRPLLCRACFHTMETLIPDGSGTWTLTFPASSSEGTQTGSQELGEGVMLAGSSEGSCDTLNTELRVIRLAGHSLPGLLAGGGGDQLGGGPKQDCVTMF